MTPTLNPNISSSLTMPVDGDLAMKIRIPKVLSGLYVKLSTPDSYLKVLFYRIPFSDEYILRFPNKGWTLINLSCYDDACIYTWIYNRRMRND